MTAERTYLAGWGSTGKTRTTAHRRYNVWAAHRTRLGTGGRAQKGGRLGAVLYYLPGIKNCPLPGTFPYRLPVTGRPPFLNAREVYVAVLTFKKFVELKIGFSLRRPPTRRARRAPPPGGPSF